MAGSKKGEISGSEFEVDSQDFHLQSQIKTLRRVDSIRVGVTLLALLMGLSILGVSADAVNTYNATHVSYDFLLPLWPDEFDLRPTVALVVGATLVMVANALSLVASKVQSVSHPPPPPPPGGRGFNAVMVTWLTRPSNQLRQRTAVHKPLMFVAPFVGLAAAVIAIIFFYAVNTSDTYDTLLSWTCRWKEVGMAQKPHFGTLCKESWAGLYLSILLIPVEAAVFALAIWQVKVEKHTSAYSQARKSSSPVM